MVNKQGHVNGQEKGQKIVAMGILASQLGPIGAEGGLFWRVKVRGLKVVSFGGSRIGH